MTFGLGAHAAHGRMLGISEGLSRLGLIRKDAGRGMRLMGFLPDQQIL